MLVPVFTKNADIEKMIFITNVEASKNLINGEIPERLTVTIVASPLKRSDSVKRLTLDLERIELIWPNGKQMHVYVTENEKFINYHTKH